MVSPILKTTNDSTPWQSGLQVTPADGTNLVAPGADSLIPTRGLLIGGAGTVKVDMADGTTVTFTIPATACGFALPLAVRRVYATGTTATLIVAFY